jgi:hypothetical protein
MSEPTRKPRKRRTSYVHMTVHSMNGAVLPESFVKWVTETVQEEALRRQIRVLINIAGGNRNA